MNLEKYSVIIALFFFAGCDLIINPNVTFEKESNYNIKITTQNKIIVENKNGDIYFTGSDTAQGITVKIVKQVTDKSTDEAKSHIEDITINKNVGKNEIDFKADYPDSKDRNYRVDFNIILPDSIDILSRLGNGNIGLREITIKNVLLDLGNGNITTEITFIDSGFADINAGNGNITFCVNKDANAKIKASVGNGIISCSGLDLKK